MLNNVERTERDTARGGAFKAFLLGAGLGTVVALLWAPARGQDARRYLGQKARDGQMQARRAAARSREIYAREKDRLGAAVRVGRTRLTNIGRHAAAAAQDVRGTADRVAGHARLALDEAQGSSNGGDAVERVGP